jgi:hypothetical protein
MIFGSPQSNRLPFHRPKQAGFYTPRIPESAFYSHIHPFMQTFPPMQAFAAQIPNLPTHMQPGVIRMQRRGPVPESDAGVTRALPMSPSRSGMIPGQVPGYTAPAPTAGFGRGFGASGGVQAPSPYRTMRSGMLPGVASSGSNVRAGVINAGAMMRRLSPSGFPGANVPAGTYSVSRG